MARIVTVYNDWRVPFEPAEMGQIRWLKISEALARSGHRVDIATNEPAWRRGWWRRREEVPMGPRLRRIPLPRVRWTDYDMVKTLFHAGFDTLGRFGGLGHPFVVSKLGSVVGPEDRPGIPFYGARREKLFATQQAIRESGHTVAVISPSARELWTALHGSAGDVLVVPGAADRDLPPPGADPFPPDGRPRALFAGHVYFRHSQPEANAVLVDKLNRLGALLARRGIHLYLLGAGDVDRIDPESVTFLGRVPHASAWDYLRHAAVGIVVAADAFLHNNESTKIYHYLRAGLPVVSEAGFPNDHVIGEAGLGMLVDNGDLQALADAAIKAIDVDWDRDRAVRYVLEHHTWDRRVEAYTRLLAARSLQPEPAAGVI